MAHRGETVPISPFRRAVLADLAGGAAMHFSPNSASHTDDLDFFHDSEARVARAFAERSASTINPTLIASASSVVGGGSSSYKMRLAYER